MYNGKKRDQNSLRFLINFILVLMFLGASGEILAADFVGYINLGRAPLKMVADGNYAYVLTDTNLIIVDISDPMYPYPVGYYYPSGTPVNFAISDHYAYLVISGYGLQIVNLKELSRPIETAAFPIKSPISDIAVSGDFVYLLDTNGLHSIDINDISHPTEKGFFRTRDTSESYQRYLVISKQFAYVASEEGLHILNMSNPASPIVVGYRKTIENFEYRRARPFGLVISGDFAYMADNSEIRKIAIRDSASSQNCTFYGSSEDVSRNRIAKFGDYFAYLDDNKLQILDLTLPAHPKELDRYCWSHPVCMAVSGHYALIGDAQNTLTIVDFSSNTTNTAHNSVPEHPANPSVHDTSEKKTPTWDTSAIKALAILPPNVSRSAILDLLIPGGLKSGQILGDIYASKCYLKPNSYIIQYGTRVVLISVSNSTGAINVIAQPVGGYLNFGITPEFYDGFCDIPVRIGRKEYALSFPASFYIHGGFGSDNLRTLTLFIIRNNLLIPVVNTTTDNSMTLQGEMDSTGEYTYTDKTESTSFEFSNKMTLGFYDIHASWTKIVEDDPDRGKGMDAIYTWDGQRYTTKDSVDLLFNANDWFDFSVPSFIERKTLEIENFVKQGQIANAMLAEFDDQPDHDILLEADKPSRLLVAGFRRKILDLTHQQAITVYKKHPDSALVTLGYGISQYIRQTPKTDTAAQKTQPPFFEYLQKDIAPETVPMLNDYAYILSKSQMPPETRDTILSRAVILLEKVILMNPDRVVAYLNLGDVQWDLGRFSDAKSQYKKYVELMGRENTKIPNHVIERLNDLRSK